MNRFLYSLFLTRRTNWGRLCGVLAVTFFSVCGLPQTASGQDVEWLHLFGGTGPAADTAEAIHGDASGSIYVAGSTDSVMPGEISQGSSDAFVRKYDALGTVIWTRQFGTGATDEALGVFVDATGVYVAGSTNGTLAGQVSAGGTDAFLQKFDVAGKLLWTSQFGTMATEQALGVSADSTGVYVVGFTDGTLPGQVNAGGMDAFVRKYDDLGEVIWTHQFGTSGADQGLAISVASTGVFVAGSVGGTLPGQVNAGGMDAFVRKYDSSGGVAWERQFGSPGSDRASGLSADALDVYVTGIVGGADAFVSKFNGDTGGVAWKHNFATPVNPPVRLSADALDVYVMGSTNGSFPGSTNAGGADAFVIKLGAVTGNVIWIRQFGTSESDEASGIYAAPDWVYVVGTTSGTLPGQFGFGGTDAFGRKYAADATEVWTLQFGSQVPVPASDLARAVDTDASGNAYVVGTTNGVLSGQIGAGLTDAFLRKYDAAGAELWTRQFGTAGVEQAFGVFADHTGVYVAGFTTRNLPGQVNPLPGTPDAFVRKYDASGKELWTRQFGTPGNDQANAVSGDPTGVYVAGSTDGPIPGQASAGVTDAFVRKYDFAGTELWTRQFGSIGVDQAIAIGADITGVYVAGSTTRSFPAQVNAAPGINDAFVRAYDADGTEQWTRQFGTPETDQALAIAVDGTGVHLAGYTGGLFPGQTGAGGTDAFVRKYDAGGNDLWTRQFGSSANDQAFGIAVDHTGVWVGGFVGTNLPGKASFGGLDLFARKYDGFGGELWTLQLGSPANDQALGVSVDSSGLRVTGSAAGTFPGQAGSGGVDALVANIVDVAEISIDIKPGAYPNTINLGSQGAVPVAIISTPLFDAGSVDPITVTLAGAAVKLKGKGTPNASLQDVDGDGRLDLVVHIATEAFQLGETDTLAVLAGATFSGRRIRGTDSIRVVP